MNNSTCSYKPPKKVFYVPPSYFCFLLHRPVLFDYWLFKHHHKFTSHSEEWNYEVGHPKHFLFTKLNVRLKSLNFLNVSLNFIIKIFAGVNILSLIFIRFVLGDFIFSCLILNICLQFFILISVSLGLIVLTFIRWALLLRIFDRAYFNLFSVFYFLFVYCLRSC